LDPRIAQLVFEWYPLPVVLVQLDVLRAEVAALLGGGHLRGTDRHGAVRYTSRVVVFP
jgi:hypothetical protein